MTARRAHVRRVAVAAGVYALFVLAIGLYPTPVDRPIDGLLSRVLRFLHRHGVPRAFDYAFVEFTANIAFFVPLGVFAALLLLHRRWWLAGVIGFAASVAIETAQATLLPGRFASALDVLANTTGAFLGATAVVLWRRYAGREARR